MGIRDYIQDNYDKIKNVLTKECKKSGFKFDEDVFHETLYKVMYNLEGLEIDENIMNYVITAFKNNIYREAKYSYNSMRKEVEDLNSINTSIDEICNNIDTLVIINDIRKNFGKEYAMYFILWCRGYTIKEILNHFGVYNLYYKFSSIKKFIKDNYETVK